MSNDITPKPKFHGQEVRDETTIRRPTHQGCLIHTKELEKHAPGPGTINTKDYCSKRKGF